MNVLILTPDAVGSTLLQRVLTIYMNFHEFDRPVINLHELTNGLEKYFSPEFNQEIVSKKRVKNWGYYQTLQEIVDLLSSVEHYKTARLAQYHVRGRGDSIDQQIPFYQYLNQNFFVIACRRRNIFEHALSQCINKITGKLNVYGSEEKIDTFWHIYKDKLVIDQTVFETAVKSYSDYLEWSSNHFNVASFFYYDTDLSQIERFVLNLPIFNGQPCRITWHDKFSSTFNDWNRMHHAPSDLSQILMHQDRLDETQLLSHYQQHAPQDWPAVQNATELAQLPDSFRTQMSIMTHSERLQTTQYYHDHIQSYLDANETIEQMIRLDILPSPLPIKKQTLAEKLNLIKNIDECVSWYNQLIHKRSDLGTHLNMDDLRLQCETEQSFWYSDQTTVSQPHSLLPMSQSQDQNDGDPGHSPVVGLRQ